MVLLNFGFTSINVQKKKTTGKKVNIKTGLAITDVSISKAVSPTDQKPFSISFKYTANYQPHAGSIELEGELIYLASKEVAEAITKQWKEKKQLPKTQAVPIYNRILHSCTVEAFVMSREVNLPAPVNLPKLQVKTGEPSKKTSKKTTKKTTAKKNSPKK